jgi:NifU-like protein
MAASAPIDIDPPEIGERVRARLNDLRFVGELREADAYAKGLELIDTAHGAEHANDHIHLTMLVDRDGVIREVKYRTLAVGAQLAAYDVMAEQCLGKTLEQAATITPEQVDALLRDSPERPALVLGNDRSHPYYVLVKAYERKHGPKPGSQPQPVQTGSSADALPWPDVGLFEKVRRIEAVLDQHVRPALASDGGGIDLVDLKDNDLFVQYHGACGSCSSSIGGTLQFIQDSLNNYLGTQLAVRVTGIEEEPLIPI